MKILKENYSKKEEENFHLKTYNQYLKEQLKKFKYDEDSQEEKFKNIQDDNKMLEDKLNKIQNETSKSSRIKLQVMETGTLTDLVHITTQDVSLVEEKHT